VRKDLWKIILIADAILVVIGIVSYAFGIQRIHVTKITGPRAIELETLTLDPGEQYSKELWVELNEPPLPPLGDGTKPTIVFDYHVAGTVEVYYEDPEGIPNGFLMTDQDFGGGSGTIRMPVWLSGSYELFFSAHGKAGEFTPPERATILSLRVTDEYFAMRENPLMMIIGGFLVFVGLATSGAGFGLMRRRSKVE